MNSLEMCAQYMSSAWCMECCICEKILNTAFSLKPFSPFSSRGYSLLHFPHSLLYGIIEIIILFKIFFLCLHAQQA
jgi:hypothetical protein